MAALERISKEDIERARQLLLAEIFTEKTDDRHVKRDAVKQLLGPLIAARESGLSFEEISKVFERAGLLLSYKTLERYYYALKTEEDLAKEAKLHAERVGKVRQAIETRALREHQEHGAKLAHQFTEEESRKPKLYNALQVGEPASPASRKAAAGAAKSNPKNAVLQSRPASPAGSETPANGRPAVPASERPGATARGNTQSALPLPARPASPAGSVETQSAADAEVEARSPMANAAPPKHALGAQLKGREKEHAGQAPVGDGTKAPGNASTIDQIEAESTATENRTTITEDVEMRGNEVFYTSGAPFVGTLTKKQIHLLRNVGRIIALTSGKSSKDFVAMPAKV